ncbi:MAG: AAA family ATPase [Solirubrobacteraceae bacterium]|nr:AAA family ATPase [Solirubrobacteraceae bacterium]
MSTDRRVTETLEREAELERIATALEDSAGGSGQLLVVEGPPGIGKSRLVEGARDLAKARGFARIKAVGDEAEQALPWGVMRQLVERSILRYSGETRDAILSGPAGNALTAIDGAGESGADEATIARTLHALWWVAADLSADRPLLITVDDAHWADLPSQRFLTYLARRLEDLSVTLVVATRPVVAGSGPLAELSTLRAQAHLLPAPLSEEAIATLAANGHAVTPRPDVVRALHVSSGGNPFYVGQLMAELDREGRKLDDRATVDAIAGLAPRAISRALLMRLSPDAVRLAGAAAVLGWSSPASLAAGVAGLEGADATEAMRELHVGRVLSPDAATCAFTHPVVRESILADLDTGRRAELHAEAARRLRDAGAPADRIAGHLAEAPPGVLPDAGALLRAAGLEALGGGDAPTAARLLRRALDEAPGTPGLQGELGRALVRAGVSGEGRALLREAARNATDLHERARLLAAASDATAALDGPLAAAEEVRGLLAAWPEGERASRLVLDARLAHLGAFHFEGSPGSGEHLAAFSDLEGRTVEERALLAMLTQRALNDGRPAAEVVQLGRRALADGALCADRDVSLLPWGLATFAVVNADGIAEGEEELRRGRAALAAGGSPGDFSTIATIAANVAWRTGDLRRCEAEAAACLDAERLGEPGPMADARRAVVTRLLVLCAIERGDLAAADEALAAHDAADPPDTVPVARLREARAALALTRDDPALARTHATALRESELRAGAVNATVSWRVLLALAADRLGDDVEARTLADEQLAAARRWGLAREIAEALMLQARLHPDRRLACLQEAVMLLEPSPARLTLAHALRRLGEALRVERRRTDARAPLERAAELATTCGATELQRQAVEAFASLGHTPRKLMFSGVEALTASERRVAELAAGGLTNRDIARELYVTPKTVENHLGRSYVKLGISGRRELRAVVAPA